MTLSVFFVTVLLKDGSSSRAAIDRDNIAWLCPCGLALSTPVRHAAAELSCKGCQRRFALMPTDNGRAVRLIKEE